MEGYCPGRFSLCTFRVVIASASSHLYCPPMFPRPWLQPGVDARLVAATHARARFSKRRGDKTLLCLDKSSVKTLQGKKRNCFACVFVLIADVNSMKSRSTAADLYPGPKCHGQGTSRPPAREGSGTLRKNKSSQHICLDPSLDDLGPCYRLCDCPLHVIDGFLLHFQDPSKLDDFDVCDR